jgi:hypothetical protein
MMIQGKNEEMCGGLTAGFEAAVQRPLSKEKRLGLEDGYSRLEMELWLETMTTRRDVELASIPLMSSRARAR